MTTLSQFSNFVNSLRKIRQAKQYLMHFVFLLSLVFFGQMQIFSQTPQSPGSVLIFPYYSSSTIPSQVDTVFNITNQSSSVLKMLLIFHYNGGNAPYYLNTCLTGNSSLQIKASDYDPLNTGSLYVIAIDDEGKPTQANALVGNAQIKRFVPNTTTPTQFVVPAHTVRKISTGSVSGTTTATLEFNGTMYERLPKTIGDRPIIIANDQPFVTLMAVSNDLTTSSQGPSGASITSTAYKANPSSTNTGTTSFTGVTTLSFIGSSGLRFSTAWPTFTSGQFGGGWFKITSNNNGSGTPGRPILAIYWHESSVGKGGTLASPVEYADSTVVVPIYYPTC